MAEVSAGATTLWLVLERVWTQVDATVHGSAESAQTALREKRAEFLESWVPQEVPPFDEDTPSRFYCSDEAYELWIESIPIR